MDQYRALWLHLLHLWDLAFKGYLCRHVLYVLHHIRVNEMHSNYISSWWCGCWFWQSRQMVRDHLFNYAIQIVQEGSKSRSFSNLFCKYWWKQIRSFRLQTLIGLESTHQFLSERYYLDKGSNLRKETLLAKRKSIQKSKRKHQQKASTKVNLSILH